MRFIGPLLSWPALLAAGGLAMMLGCASSRLPSLEAPPEADPRARRHYAHVDVELKRVDEELDELEDLIPRECPMALPTCAPQWRALALRYASVSRRLQRLSLASCVDTTTKPPGYVEFRAVYVPHAQARRARMQQLEDAAIQTASSVPSGAERYLRLVCEIDPGLCPMGCVLYRCDAW